MAKVTHKEKIRIQRRAKNYVLTIFMTFRELATTIGHWDPKLMVEYEEDDNIVLPMDIEIQITIKVDEDGMSWIIDPARRFRAN